MANMNCKCGGRFTSIDSYPRQYDRVRNTFYYTTIRNKAGYASWTCNKCNKIQEQKLRVAKAKRK